MRRSAGPIAAAASGLVLAGCLVGPAYRPPPAPSAAAYKEAALPPAAALSDAATRPDWWTAFGDGELSALEARAAAANQSVLAADAAWREARALIGVQRAALFPTVGLNAGAGASGGGGLPTTQSYSLGLGASWAPDFFGRVRRQIESARDTAQASAADLANARLAVESELALDYISLRQIDEEKRLLDETAAAYQLTLTITENKYRVGVAALGDVLTARGQLQSTQAQDADLIQQRARLEHAIAVLIGVPPAGLALRSAPWKLTLPTIPVGVPSALLRRRPDIVAAERSMASANAQIGVAVAAYYPNITLTGQAGFAAGELGALFSAASWAWSASGSAAETIFDGGARKSQVAAARAAYEQAVANWRQTVLTAFVQVEDNLAAQRVFAHELVLREAAARSARGAEAIARNQYRAGQVDETTVVVAQANALAARTSELAVEAERLMTAVDLIAALGGGWSRDTDPRLAP